MESKSYGGSHVFLLELCGSDTIIVVDSERRKFVVGACFDLWHPGWLIFFFVPIISTLIHAVRKRNADLFAYPILVVLIFLYVGLVHFIWHPTWVIFLTIPLYYSLTGFVRRTRAKDVEEEENKRDV